MELAQICAKTQCHLCKPEVKKACAKNRCWFTVSNPNPNSDFQPGDCPAVFYGVISTQKRDENGEFTQERIFLTEGKPPLETQK